MAWVKPRDAASLDDEMLRAFCRCKIQKFRSREVLIEELSLSENEVIGTV